MPRPPRAIVHRRPRGRAGFTLVEVLASILLIGIVLPVAMDAISLSNGIATVARQRTEAAMLAETRLQQLLATQGWQGGTASGDFSDLGNDWPDYRWDAQTIDWNDPTQLAQNLHQLDVHVTWQFRHEQHSVTVSTVIYVSQAATGSSSSSSSTGGAK